MIIFLISVIWINIYVNSWVFIILVLILISLIVILKFPLTYDYFLETLYVDTLSFNLIFLSTWITILIIIARYSIFKSKTTIYLKLISILLLALILRFLTINTILFYFFFECSLIPIMLIISGWGFQPERLQASIYLLFYTLFGSLPLLIVIFYLNFKTERFNIILRIYKINFSLIRLILIIFLFSAFLIKIPIFIVHLWLPKAHVEAPVAGSIILAGVLLKLGSYGIIRFLPHVKVIIPAFNSALISIRISSIIFIGLSCCRTNDLKALVAYSSVAHIAIIIAGVYSYFNLGFSGRLILILRHGLRSSGIFFFLNTYYERIGRRSLFINKRIIIILPTIGLFLFLLAALNIAAPPSLNLISEIFLIFSILRITKLIIILFPIGSFLGAIYVIFMFSFSQHGKNLINIYSIFNIKHREFHNLSLHIIPTFLVFSKSNFLFIIYLNSLN